MQDINSCAFGRPKAEKNKKIVSDIDPHLGNTSFQNQVEKG